jgi:hypothetical protein
MLVTPEPQEIFFNPIHPSNAYKLIAVTKLGIIISVSDVQNNFDIKNQLDKAHLDGNMDPDKIYTCKYCFLIVKDPKECSECNGLICSKCL